MSWAIFCAGVVKFIGSIFSWIRDKMLVDAGKKIRQGEYDAATLENIKNALDAKYGDNDALDDELRIRPGEVDNDHRRNMRDLLKK